MANTAVHAELALTYRLSLTRAHGSLRTGARLAFSTGHVSIALRVSRPPSSEVPMSLAQAKAPATPPAMEPSHALTHEHLGLVHHVAHQVARQLHDQVSIDELVSAGTLGLMQAA